MNRHILHAALVVAMVFVALAFVGPSLSRAAHFPDPVPSSQSVSLTGAPTVYGSPMVSGDEVAAYSTHPRPGVAGQWEKTLIGHAVIGSDGSLNPVMAVYGDDPATAGVVEGAVPGEEICLVLWRVSEGKEYAAYGSPTGAPASITWTTDGGTVAADVDFAEGQRIPLRTGAWNLFSYGVLQGYQAQNRPSPAADQLPGVTWTGVPTLGDAFPLMSIAGKYDRLLGNDGTGATFWNPALPTISSMAYLAPGYGYWVKMKPSSSPLSWLTVPGSRTLGTEQLPLNRGWTLAGYWGGPVHHVSSFSPWGALFPVDTYDNVVHATIGDLWYSLGADYVRVTSFDGTGAHLWNPSLPSLSTLRYIGPGYGYWVKMSAWRSLTYAPPDPTSPLGVRAAAGDRQIIVSWNPVAGASSYNLYWSQTPDISRTTGTQIPGVTSPYLQAGLTNGTAYYYVVTAVVEGIESPDSPKVSAVPAVPPPTIASFAPASGPVGTYVTITGTGFDNVPANNTVRFNGTLARVSAGSATQIWTTVPAGAATGPITVTNSRGTATSAASFSVLPAPPDAPTGVRAVPGNAQVTVSWDPVPGATSYNIYYGTAWDVTKTTGTPVVGASNPRTVTGLANGTTYFFVVTAVGANGESADSNRISAQPASSTPPVGVTKRVSVDSSNVQGGQASPPTTGWAANVPPSLSDDGRYVTFVSGAANLVPGDTNGFADVFVRDTKDNVTTRVSVASDGTQGNGDSTVPAISADGRFVVFNSTATNLDSTNPCTVIPWVFLHDRNTGITSRVPGPVCYLGANGPSAISADGRYVAYGSVGGTITLHDTSTNTDNSFGFPPMGGSTTYGSSNPSLSGDGSLVAFVSDWQLDVNDNNHARDVFLYNNITGTTLQLTNAVGTISIQPRVSMSRDGRFIAYASADDNVVAGDTNGTSDVFVQEIRGVFRDAIGPLTRVSVATDNSQGNNYSWDPSLNSTGQVVTFSSWADNLVAGDTNSQPDVFIRDIGTGETRRISVGPGSLQAIGSSRFAAVSPDGTVACFASQSANLVTGDTNNVQDVFCAATGSGVSLIPPWQIMPLTVGP
jgi:hypothetical protein